MSIWQQVSIVWLSEINANSTKVSEWEMGKISERRKRLGHSNGWVWVWVNRRLGKLAKRWIDGL